MVEFITFKKFVGKQETWQLPESLEPKKGAFKHLPTEEQPQRIPIKDYDEIAKWVKDNFSYLGKIFIPDATKKAFGRDTTGDVDVILEPKDRKGWMEPILKSPYIKSHVKNGPQLMTVMQHPDGRKLMIDFILAKPQSFDYRAKYAQFGTIIPAVLGSFARSMSYKYDQNGLYARVKDNRNNFHNILLTKDFNTAMRILMLDTAPVKEDRLYTPQQVAEWVASSPRFDSDRWKKPHTKDGMDIVVRNRKSHSAAKKKPEVVETYKLLDATDKKGTWDNSGYKIERQVLGDKFVEKFLLDVKSLVQKSRRVLDGGEIIKILGIKPGPQIAKWIEYLNKHPQFKDLKQEELDKPEVKEQARNILRSAYESHAKELVQKGN